MPYNKYYKQKKQVSYDDGQTWEDVIPYEYQKGALYEEDSPDCQPISQYKLQATYSGGQHYNLECDGNKTLTENDTRPSGYQITAMTNAVIGDCVEIIGLGALGAGVSLTSVTISNTVWNIGPDAFGHCYSLTSIGLVGSGASVEIPDSVSNISDDAFVGCSGLTSVVLPDSVGAISNRAFQHCDSLTSITIGNGVWGIGHNAFENCTGLTSFTCLAITPPDIGDNVFDNTNNCPIYVPANSVNAYKTASGWSSYASRIFPIQT